MQPYTFEEMDQQRQQQQRQQQQQWFLSGSPAHNPTYLPPPSPQWQQQQQQQRQQQQQQQIGFIGPLLPQQQQDIKSAGLWQDGLTNQQPQQQQQQQQHHGISAAAAVYGSGSSSGLPTSPERVFSGQLLMSAPLPLGQSLPQPMLTAARNSSPSPAATAAGRSSHQQQQQQQQMVPVSSAPVDLPVRDVLFDNTVDDIMESENMSWRPGTHLGLTMTGFNRTNSLEGPLPPLQSPQAPPPLALQLPWQQQQQGEAAAAAAGSGLADRDRMNSISSLIPGSPVVFGNAAAAGGGDSSRGAGGVSNLAAVLLHQHSGQQQQQQQVPRRPATAGGGTPLTVVPCAATGSTAIAAANTSSIGIDALLAPAAAAAAVDRGDPVLLLPVTSGLRRGGSIRSYSFSGGDSLSPASAAAAAAAAAKVAAGTVRAEGGSSSSSMKLAAAGSSLWQQQTKPPGPPSGSAPNSYQAASMMIPVTNTSSNGSDGSPSPSAAAAAAAAGSSRLGKGFSCPSSTVNLQFGPSSSGAATAAAAAAAACGSSAKAAAAVPGTLTWLHEPVFDLPPFTGHNAAAVPERFDTVDAAAADGDDTNMEEEQQQQQRDAWVVSQGRAAAPEDTDMQEQQGWQRRRSSVAGMAAAAAAAAAVAAADQNMDDEVDDTKAAEAAAAAVGGTMSDDDLLQRVVHQMEDAAAAAEALDVCLNCTAPLLVDFDDDDDDDDNDDNDADDDSLLDSNNKINEQQQDSMEGVVRGPTTSAAAAAAAGGGATGRSRLARASSSSSGVVCFSCGHRQLDDRALMTGCIPDKLAESAAGSTRGCVLRPFPATATAAAAASRPLLAFDAGLLSHCPPVDSSHPERPERAAAVVSRLMARGLAQQCRRVPCRAAGVDELAAVHDTQLIRELQVASKLQQQEVAAAAAAAAQQPSEIHRTPAGSGQHSTLDSPLHQQLQQQQQQQHSAAAAAVVDPAAGVSHGSELGASHILDCYIGPATYNCAAMAAGGAIDVAVAVVQGHAPSGAAIIRPPGHHAEGGLAMGFCYFNNAAVAARAAQSAGAGKVLILDWDVHHGNGTQAIFESDPSVMYMSIHRYDFGNFFPGTGHVEDVGQGAAAGSTVNVPWDAAGPGDADYMAAFTRVLLPIAYEFAPDLIIVSAGFDAAHGDPLGGCHVSPACFGHMTALLQPIAPLALLLEGGYNLAATAASVEACVRVLLGQPPARMQTPLVPTPVGLAAIASAVAVQSRYWRCLAGGMTGPLADSSNHHHHQQQQHHHHSKAVGQHPTHVPQQQQQQQIHSQEQQQQTQQGNGQEGDGVWRINSLPPPGTSSNGQQQQQQLVVEVHRTATPALGMPAPAPTGFQPVHHHHQQQQGINKSAEALQRSGGVTAALGAAAAAAGGGGGGSNDLLDPFALHSGLSFTEASHAGDAHRAQQTAGVAEGDGQGQQQQQHSGSGVGDSLLLAHLRRQLQSEGGPSLEMPLSAAPTLSSTFSL